MEQQKQLHLIMEWDLQWFAKDGPGGEKTEPATAKKLREAREDGKVVKSKELTAAFDLIILFLVLKIFLRQHNIFFCSLTSVFQKLKKQSLSRPVLLLPLPKGNNISEVLSYEQSFLFN